MDADVQRADANRNHAVASDGGAAAERLYESGKIQHGASGNVEVSSVIVDAAMEAIADFLPRLQADGQGTMNNLALANEHLKQEITAASLDYHPLSGK